MKSKTTEIIIKPNYHRKIISKILLTHYFTTLKHHNDQCTFILCKPCLSALQSTHSCRSFIKLCRGRTITLRSLRFLHEIILRVIILTPYVPVLQSQLNRYDEYGNLRTTQVQRSAAELYIALQKK